jgi:hypothetical protein
VVAGGSVSTASGTACSLVQDELSLLGSAVCALGAAVEISGAGRAAEREAGTEAARRACEAAGAPNGTVARSPRGRPRWPAGFLGSIAHAAGIAVAAVAPAPPRNALGLDIESEAALPAPDATCVMSQEEASLLRYAGTLQNQLATRLWSAKEAAFKAWCTALDEDLDDVDPREIVVRPILPAADLRGLPFSVVATGGLAARSFGPLAELNGRWLPAGELFVTLAWA